MSIRSIFVILAGLCGTAASATECPSHAFTRYDFGGEYDPIGEGSVPSAMAGQAKTLSVVDIRGGEVCEATVVCNYGGYWTVNGVECGGNTSFCPATQWTVYDLGGWAPVGGVAYLPTAGDGYEMGVPTTASNGRSCEVQAVCELGHWTPDFRFCR
jgi:hypothetical protein